MKEKDFQRELGRSAGVQQVFYYKIPDSPRFLSGEARFLPEKPFDCLLCGIGGPLVCVELKVASRISIRTDALRHSQVCALNDLTWRGVPCWILIYWSLYRKAIAVTYSDWKNAVESTKRKSLRLEEIRGWRELQAHKVGQAPGKSGKLIGGERVWSLAPVLGSLNIRRLPFKS